MASPSPTAAHFRARVASLSRDRDPNDPELLDARRRLRALKIEEYLTAQLAAAPPLNDEQRTRLAELLRPARQTLAARKRGGAA